MSDVLPTVKIKTENGPVIINLKDYDAEKHELFVSDDEPKKEPFDRKAAFEYLGTLGATPAKNTSNEKLAELVAEMKAKVGQQTA